LRLESLESKPDGFAMLNALSSALFTLTLRVASESLQAPTGLLASAGHPRLFPAMSAMLQEPAKQWTLPMLAQLCNTSRATFMRHFETVLGRSATDLLADTCRPFLKSCPAPILASNALAVVGPMPRNCISLLLRASSRAISAIARSCRKRCRHTRHVQRP
jgi:hypothetical protein